MMKSPSLHRSRLKGVFWTLLTLFFLGLMGCASSGPSTAGDSASVAPGDGSNFSGTYVLRAQDCEPFDGIIVFSVTQTGNNFVITIEEVDGDTWIPGDQITGTVVEGGGNFIANVQELQCVAKLILNTAEVDDANSRLAGGVAQIGDLDSFCQDESADTFCTLIYQHANYD